MSERQPGARLDGAAVESFYEGVLAALDTALKNERLKLKQQGSDLSLKTPREITELVRREYYHQLGREASERREQLQWHTEDNIRLLSNRLYALMVQDYIFDRLVSDLEQEHPPNRPNQRHDSESDRQRLLKKAGRLIDHLVQARQLVLDARQSAEIGRQVVERIVGYGPIDEYINDPEIEEIMVNGPNKIFVARRGGARIEKVDKSFRDEDHILQIIERIVGPIGRRIDESSPMVDARLPGGDRVNAVVRPLPAGGPALTIRRFTREPFRLDGLSTGRTRSLDPEGRLGAFLRACVMARVNILVSGGTGSGKTSLLNALAYCIEPQERVIVIEDSSELRLPLPNLVQLESRPPNIEGAGEIGIRRLVKNALRMRPDRIVVGEVRGDEVFDMLQAMNTGHPGSMTTVHANNPEHALRRLEAMLLMVPGMTQNITAIRQQIVGAIQIVVHQRRFPRGERRVTHVWEVDSALKLRDGSGELDYGLRPIFELRYQLDPDSGELAGECLGVGKGISPDQPPKCVLEEMLWNNIALDRQIFRDRPAPH